MDLFKTLEEIIENYRTLKEIPITKEELNEIYLEMEGGLYDTK